MSRLLPYFLRPGINQCAALLSVLCIAVGMFFSSGTCAAAEEVPRAALRYRAQLIREAHAGWGLDAPSAALAAQVHQESGWRDDAVSPVGAKGMAQFMPATAKWANTALPGLKDLPTYSTAWSLRALVVYDKWLWDRVRGTDSCNRMAKVDASYNMGLGWIYRAEHAATAKGVDAGRWWGAVELVNPGQSAAAFAESRGYPRRILITLAPRYVAAGFGASPCAS